MSKLGDQRRSAETAGLEDRYSVLIESSVRQQFAGPLGSRASMQMPALHFTLGEGGISEAALQGPVGESMAGVRRMFRCRRRKLEPLHKS